jgi:16S rRNA (uracil1498-N3)-methyltransferase
MQIPRFFLTSEDVRQTGMGGGLAPTSLDLQPGGEIEIANSAMANQVKNVLRLSAGDKVHLLNGAGALFECSLSQVTSSVVACRVEARRNLPADSVDVCLALAVLKGDRFDWALQKATELGVSSIVPLLTARTVVKIDSSDAKGTKSKLTRWQAIVREAAEQSERATIPNIVAPIKLVEWFDQNHIGGTDGIAYLCAERMATEHLRDILLELRSRSSNNDGTAGKTIFLVVGPEGGFIDEEIALAQERGFKPVSLGARILRAETAAIYAVAQVIWCLEK